LVLACADPLLGVPVPSPAVTPTNLLLNVAAVAGSLLRFFITFFPVGTGDDERYR
jgi:hypothetical protein